MANQSEIVGLLAETQRDLPEDAWNEDTVCNVSRILYDFLEHTCWLFVSPRHNTDMSGSIRLAKRIDPEVQRVIVYEGENLDIVYQKHDDGWDSSNYRRVRERAAKGTAIET